MAEQQDLRPTPSDRRAGRWLICAGAALAMLWACAPKPASRAEPPSTGAAAAKPVLSSNLDQIQNQYASNPAAARTKYAKVAVQFTAVADEVIAAPAQGFTIGFHTAQHPQDIRAVFPDAGAGGAASIRRGAVVMARCDKVVEVGPRLELQGCALR